MLTHKKSLYYVYFNLFIHFFFFSSIIFLFIHFKHLHVENCWVYIYRLSKLFWTITAYSSYNPAQESNFAYNLTKGTSEWPNISPYLTLIYGIIRSTLNWAPQNLMLFLNFSAMIIFFRMLTNDNFEIQNMLTKIRQKKNKQTNKQKSKKKKKKKKQELVLPESFLVMYKTCLILVWGAVPPWKFTF